MNAPFSYLCAKVLQAVSEEVQASWQPQLHTFISSASHIQLELNLQFSTEHLIFAKIFTSFFQRY